MQAYGWLLTTPGAPLLYYGDEYGEYGGADPDNRHMYRNESSWSTMETQLFENISELGKLRSESIALQRGEYSTRLAMSNLLVYNMTHDDQAMSVVLNRGAPTTINGFANNDVIRFGESSMLDGTLSVGLILSPLSNLMLISSCLQYTDAQIPQQRILTHLRQQRMAHGNIQQNQSLVVRIARLQILMMRQPKMMAVVSTIQTLAVMCNVTLVLKVGP